MKGRYCHFSLDDCSSRFSRHLQNERYLKSINFNPEDRSEWLDHVSVNDFLLENYEVVCQRRDDWMVKVCKASKEMGLQFGNAQCGAVEGCFE